MGSFYSPKRLRSRCLLQNEAKKLLSLRVHQTVQKRHWIYGHRRSLGDLIGRFPFSTWHRTVRCAIEQ
jgi:hypothetical protein